MRAIARGGRCLSRRSVVQLASGEEAMSDDNDDAVEMSEQAKEEAAAASLVDAELTPRDQAAS